MSDPNGMKRLYKSRTDRMIDGVCGGTAKYFNLDPTLVRIAWVLLTLLGGSGILLYIVAMIIMPKEPYVVPNFSSAEPGQTVSSPPMPDTSASSRKNSLFWGILLIGVGLFIFMSNMGFSFWHPWWWFNEDTVLPLLLILAGVAFLWGGRNSLTNTTSEFQVGAESDQSTDAARTVRRKLARSYNDSKLFGVCGGLGEYFEIDSTIIRALTIVGAFASGGAVVLCYILMAIVLPKEAPSFKTV